AARGGGVEHMHGGDRGRCDVMRFVGERVELAGGEQDGQRAPSRSYRPPAGDRPTARSVDALRRKHKNVGGPNATPAKCVPIAAQAAALVVTSRRRNT